MNSMSLTETTFTPDAPNDSFTAAVMRSTCDLLAAACAGCTDWDNAHAPADNAITENTTALLRLRKDKGKLNFIGLLG